MTLIPPLNLSKIQPAFSHANTAKQSSMQTTNPLKKLQILSGAVPLMNQSSVISDESNIQNKLSQRAALLGAAGLNTGKGDTKKVSSTLNTLRGLESGRNIKSFENLGSQPNSFVSNLFQDQAPNEIKQDKSKDIQNEYFEEMKIEEVPDDFISKPDKLTEQFKQLKIQDIKNKEQNLKEEVKIPPKKNYFAALTSIRQIQDDKILNPDIIFKSKTNVQEDKKNKPNVVDKEGKYDQQKTVQTSNNNLNLLGLNLPKSPYLTSMRKHFDNVGTGNLSKKTSAINIEEINQNSQITSPYITFSRTMPKEQRLEHLKRLRQHVNSHINKDQVKPKDLKNIKIIPISNAFTLNIKNERDLVLKNMENLRKSVKLKKRANPLEKIMTKLIIAEKDELNTPCFQNQSLIKLTPMKQISHHQLTNNSQDSQVLQSFKLNKLKQLQAIDEDVEDEQQQTVQSIQSLKQNVDPVFNLDQQYQTNLIQTNIGKFAGMSPIITFRPLNKFSNDQSSQNTPLGTPMLQPRASITQREHHQSQNLNSSFNQDDSNPLYQLHLLQTAKKELDILENLKSIAIDIFNISIQIKSSKSQLQILQKYLEQLKIIKIQQNVSTKTFKMLEIFTQAIQDKIKALEQLDLLERQYFKTLPSSAKQSQLQDEKIHKNILQRKMNTSVQSRDINNHSPNQNFRKASGVINKSNVFFPRGFAMSPKKEHSTQQLDQNFFNYVNPQDALISRKQFSQNDSLFKQQNQNNNNLPELSNSPISYPSDSSMFQVIYSGDNLVQGTSKQISATPQIQSRSIRHLQKSDIQHLQSKLPGGLFSLSQINSPIMMDPFLQNNRVRDLHSIEEERVKEVALKESERRLPYAQEARKKSQFSNQNKPHPRQKLSKLSCIEGQSQSPISQGSFVSQRSKNQHRKIQSEEISVSDSDQSSNIDDDQLENYETTFNKKTPSKNSQSSSLQKKSTFGKKKQITLQMQKIPLLEQMDENKLSHALSQPEQNIIQAVKKRTLAERGKKLALHQRNQSCNEKSVINKAKKSPRRKSQYHRTRTEFKLFEKQSYDSTSVKNDCQSDIVTGNNFDKQSDQPEEQEAFSDYHEMFYVYELFKDQTRFDNLLMQIQAKDRNRMHEIEEFLLDDDDEDSDNYNIEQNEDDYDDEDQALTMNRVRFSSVCILPSQIDSCSLENYEKNNDEISIHDFILLKTISKGAYGKVILARKKNTSDLFAVKVLDKEKMVEKNVTEYVMNERDILNKMQNEFIVRGVYTFQSKKYLYMVMEFMKGGDFAALLEQFGLFDEDTAKYYLAQIVLALEYLHQNGVIHRDLKPDNVLIDADGHIKLTDFGLSEAGLKHFKESVQRDKGGSDVKHRIINNTSEKDIDMQKDIQNVLGCEAQVLKANLDEIRQETFQQMKRIKTQPSIEKSDFKDEELAKLLDADVPIESHLILQCSTPAHHDNTNKHQMQQPQIKKRILGTADYMAPEVILGKDHTFSLDFWSLGVVAYEFMTGSLPFNDDTPEKVFKRILNRQISFPPIGREEDQMSPEAYDFINSLLTLDPTKRLGYKSINEVKKHPFLADIDWAHLMESEPPFRPVGRDQDATYFPNANDKDEDLKIIINDQKHINEQQIAKEFNRFDSVSYGTLKSINAKEAKKAIIRAEKCNQKKKLPTVRSSLFDESILMDLKAVNSFHFEDEEMKEMDDEETPSVMRKKL